MSFELFDTVVLVRDLPAHGLRGGDVGAIVEVYGEDAFEVEFVTAAGRTVALVSVAQADLRPVRDSDLLTVRSARTAVG